LDLRYGGPGLSAQLIKIAGPGLSGKGLDELLDAGIGDVGTLAIGEGIAQGLDLGGIKDWRLSQDRRRGGGADQEGESDTPDHGWPPSRAVEGDALPAFTSISGASKPDHALRLWPPNGGPDMEPKQAYSAAAKG
jgi:hypothetical protein